MKPEAYFIALDPSDFGPLGQSMSMGWSIFILNALTKIEINPVGLLLLREFQRYRVWVKIRPYTFEDVTNVKLYCNAESGGNVEIEENRRYGAFVRASLERFSHGTVCARRSAKQGGAVRQPHERLFHELVHALRNITEKTSYKHLRGGLKGYEEVEEFIAVLVTNIYASAGGKKVLRADWKGHRRLDCAFDGSLEYFRQGSMTYPIVADFYAANKAFCLLLANIKARFNPIRAFVENTEQARRYSEGDTAKHRDRNLPASQLMYD